MQELSGILANQGWYIRRITAADYAPVSPAFSDPHMFITQLLCGGLTVGISYRDFTIMLSALLSNLGECRHLSASSDEYDLL
ncbi:hypothetical protein CVT26_012704 [Gymnopilus dilepis]|uniref:Uncharacterized protein n=1 Tax=Gymnopilus dilepis TaxID=231916 RepID=A0A409YPE1_9AGAR|nr:hypothetical protein CVT26_012704 [Gymnopilus dilepis]